MNKIKFDTVTVVVIIAILILALLLARNHFESVKKRITELEDELQRELEKLNLSSERQKELTSNAVRTYQMFLGIAFVTFCSITGVSIWFGMSYADALEVNVGTVGFILAMISVVGYDFWNPDKLLNALKKKIKDNTYKKNGFDPNEIALSQLRIDELHDQLKKEKEKLLADGMTMEMNVS